MITRKDIAAHLENNVRVGFLMGQKEYQPMRSAFTREAPSDGAFEVYADMQSSPWPTLNSGKGGVGGTDTRTGVPIAGQINAGRNVTIWGGGDLGLIVRNLDYEIAVGVSHNAINDDRAGDLETWARQAARTYQKHMDYLCFDALNNGEAATKYGYGYDGNEFFDNSHIDPQAVYQTAQDNLYALALSLDNFQTVKVAAAKFLDGNGQPAGLNHNLLIVPPDLEYTAAQIALNREAYDTGNRELNPYAGTVRMLVAPGGWLDTTAWFLADPNDLVKPLILQVRQAPQLVVVDNEFEGDGGVRYFIWRARYNVAYGSWMHCVQGNS
jgi:phage major head subunit gpT-like protein